ncbi:MarR family winged helix-turn-helix transcriptional regulator [Leifsonia sp. NPDC102414]|uniref:MarR family winged helix-turn-helix transcriptional regulator n=1 Tax=Leifsonia sp. NPDC102414 TaxID=3364124 RepID=UPI00380A71A9
MPDNVSARLPVILRELAWTIHKRSPDRAGVGPLPTTEVALLKQVVDAPGSTVGELSAALGLRQPNASAAIRVLVGKGLVERAADETDKRTVRIVPTAFGRAEHEAIAADWAGAVAEAIAQLGARDRAALEAASGAMTELTKLVRGV